MVYSDIYCYIVAYKLHPSIPVGLQRFSLSSTDVGGSMKKIRDYLRRAYNILAELSREIFPIPLVGLVTMLLLISILLKILGM